VPHHEFGLGRGNELCDVKASLNFSIRSARFKAVKVMVHFLRILGTPFWVCFMAPTILIDGVDPFGAAGHSQAYACRVDATPPDNRVYRRWATSSSP
jgi:hypothetical protein